MKKYGISYEKLWESIDSIENEREGIENNWKPLLFFALDIDEKV